MGKLEAPAITATPPKPVIGGGNKRKRGRAAKETPTEGARLARAARWLAAKIGAHAARLEASGHAIAKGAAEELEGAKEACEAAAVALDTLPAEFTLKRVRGGVIVAGTVVQFRDRFCKLYGVLLPKPSTARFTVSKVAGKIALCEGRLELAGATWPLPIAHLKPTDK